MKILAEDTFEGKLAGHATYILLLKEGQIDDMLSCCVLIGTLESFGVG